jgi:alcohol dehydrogenase class IV
VIVRWGLGALPDVLAEAGIERPLLVTTERWSALELPVARRFTGVASHAEASGVAEALAASEGADGLVALGGGSAIDTAKAVSAETGLPVVSVPTTYSGAEWTTGFGSRDAATGRKRQGSGARLAGAVYEPELTVGLPRGETVGSALNALAHCAEALYAPGRTAETDADALEGARLIDAWLPAVVAEPADLEERTGLLRGAMHAGAALRAGVGIGHAMAQALGGYSGGSHGAMNAIALPAALRFNAEAAGEAIARFAAALGTEDAAARVEELGALGGFRRLREHRIAEEALPAISEAAAERSGARANPRPAAPSQILELLRSIW